MHAKCEGEFAPMMYIMLKNMPDDPLTRVLRSIFAVFFVRIGILEDLLKIGRSPVYKGTLDHLPGCLKPGDEFRSRV